MTANVTEGRTPEQEALAAPLSLAPGSYDVLELLKGTNKAVAGKPDNRDDAVAAAIAKADTSAHEKDASSIEPGHELREIEREDLGVTETVQVFTGATAEDSPAPVETAKPAAPAAPSKE